MNKKDLYDNLIPEKFALHYKTIKVINENKNLLIQNQ